MEKETDTTQVFVACNYDQHYNCAEQFTYKGETFTCQCDCHDEA